jgi:hypothetical protein
MRGHAGASFIPARPRQLRDLTRHRPAPAQERTGEEQRAEKLLEAAAAAGDEAIDEQALAAHAGEARHN